MSGQGGKYDDGEIAKLIEELRAEYDYGKLSDWERGELADRVLDNVIKELYLRSIGYHHSIEKVDK